MSTTIDITDKICQIKEANKAYRCGVPIISDTDYDNLVDEVASAMGKDFESIRNTLTEEKGSVHHPYAMGSLGKIKAYDDESPIKKWIYNHIPDNGDGTEGMFVSSKIDGCSARLTYKNGILVGASTRGDGSDGVDILHKVSMFVDTKIAKTFSGDIRGEITLTRETLEQLSSFNGKTYKNLRNATVGLINSTDASDEEYSFLRFFPYEIMGHTGMTKGEQFKRLKALGFTTALYREFTDIYNSAFNAKDAYDDALMAIYNSFSEEAPFDIDGLVISDLRDDEVFEDQFIPERTVAVKFNQMTAESTLIDIQWRQSKSGKLHPVGIIEPVVLGGAEVVAVTLNNLRYIKELGVKYGCRVNVLKSGDIIPKIVGVSHPNPEIETDIIYPEYCPSCGSELSYDADSLFPMCENEKCVGVLASRILHFLRKLNIKHLSLKTIKKFRLFSISDILNIQPDGSAVKATFIKDLDSRMFGVDKETLLTAFDYDGVSEKIIEKMLGHYGYDSLLNSTAEELKKSLPYGVGDKFIDKFKNGWERCKDDYNRIISDSRYHGQNVVKSKVTAISGILSGKGFVVTGDLKTMGREEFKKTVIENGGVYQSGISKKTAFLVTNDASTGTTKIKKAKDLGVQIINEEKFLNMIQHGNGNSDFSIF